MCVLRYCFHRSCASGDGGKLVQASENQVYLSFYNDNADERCLRRQRGRALFATTGALAPQRSAVRPQRSCGGSSRKHPPNVREIRADTPVCPYRLRQVIMQSPTVGTRNAVSTLRAKSKDVSTSLNMTRCRTGARPNNRAEQLSLFAKEGRATKLRREFPRTRRAVSLRLIQKKLARE